MSHVEHSFLIQGTGGGCRGEVMGIDPAHDGILGTYEVKSNCTGTMRNRRCRFRPAGSLLETVQRSNGQLVSASSVDR